MRWNWSFRVLNLVWILQLPLSVLWVPYSLVSFPAGQITDPPLEWRLTVIFMTGVWSKATNALVV